MSVFFTRCQYPSPLRELPVFLSVGMHRFALLAFALSKFCCLPLPYFHSHRSIYSKFGTTPGAFTDVTVGDNRCSEDNSWFNCVSCTGYAATKGWDPVTGWGTPRFDVWTQIVASLP